MKNLATLFFILLLSSFQIVQAEGRIEHNPTAKTIKVSDALQNLSISIDYSAGCKITEVNIKGKNTLSPSGVYTSVKQDQDVFSSSAPLNETKIKELKNGIEISNIKYGNDQLTINETWTFNTTGNKINWDIVRKYDKNITLDDMAFPCWNFADLSVWKGGIFNNGGMVWCKYLAKKNDTYGVHTAGVTFWNPDTGDAFRITPTTNNNKHLASKYSHNEKDEFAFTQYATDSELGQRHNLSRFVNSKSDVFAPFDVHAGETTLSLDLQYIDYKTAYSRGTLPGIDTDAVRELLNTTGRYGVVDNNIIGANGWTTNWKCLHEPFFAQIGMAINDKNYTDNMSATLNQERDLAMLNDGRVLSRWHDILGDEIPGTYNLKTGYYEAMWGYTIDSQTGYIINTSEQFDLCGDVDWLKSHKTSCEKALDWLIKRDSNNNGIFEMMNNNINEQKASDWLDIVWASFENAFVNAQMYEALTLWANCETILGDSEKATYYLKVAARLKEAFNKPVDEGGFWLPSKKQYIYWRDKDGSIHGDNLVTPVNFAAIAFGLCDDEDRIATILKQIEERNVAENLFHWPLCFDSYKREEVHINNWPFPKYENGDIFPTWGYLGIRAYVNYDKAIALKYIHNILNQYNKDGLSSQRYSRQTQLGLGDDILAGISTTVTALYRDIYGIQPKWNRMGIEPNMSEILNGATFDYTLRNITYHLKLSVNDYEMSTERFSIKNKNGFGATMNNNNLTFYPDNKDERLFTISAKNKQPIKMTINEWTDKKQAWTITSNDNYTFEIDGLNPNASYELLINNKPTTAPVATNGKVSLSYNCKNGVVFELRTK